MPQQRLTIPHATIKTQCSQIYMCVCVYHSHTHTKKVTHSVKLAVSVVHNLTFNSEIMKSFPDRLALYTPKSLSISPTAQKNVPNLSPSGSLSAKVWLQNINAMAVVSVLCVCVANLSCPTVLTVLNHTLASLSSQGDR